MKTLFRRLNPFVSRNHVHLGNGKFLDIRNGRIHAPVPNLLVIGAQKAGTTSLHRYLSYQPGVFMTAPLKEPGYFMDSDFFRRYLQNQMRINVRSRSDLLKNYMLRGYHGEEFIGESSTYYTLGERSLMFGIPQRIKHLSPEARFIYILRNPLDRIVSAYLHLRRKNLTSFDINHFGQDSAPSATDNSLLSTSLYFKQLSHYFELFEKERFLILIFEQFVRDPNTVLDAVLRFLKLPYPPVCPEFKTFNKSHNRRQFEAHELLFKRDVYEQLMEAIAPDVGKLEQFLGAQIKEWDLSPATWCQSRKILNGLDGRRMI